MEQPNSSGFHEDAVAGHSFLDPSQFGTFGFPYQQIPDGSNLEQLPGDAFGESFSEAGMVAAQQHQGGLASSAAPDEHVAAHSNPFLAMHDDASKAAPPSDDESQDSLHGNSNDNHAVDDLGIVTTGAGNSRGDDPDQRPRGGSRRATGDDRAGRDGDGSATGDLIPAPWSELKTKAGKDRKRLPLACIACRRKKIRCSGEKPACAHCLKSRIPCVYKVTTRKAAPRTDYMAMLDKRLRRMEERIIKVIPKHVQESATASVTRAVVKPSIPGSMQSAKAAAATKKRGADEAFGELDAWARTARPKTDSPGGDKRPNPLVAKEIDDSELLYEGSDALPSMKIQEHLSEVFFENVYGQAYHILHKPSFLRKLKYVARQFPPIIDPSPLTGPLEPEPYPRS
jgi:hypothetical protein